MYAFTFCFTEVKVKENGCYFCIRIANLQLFVL